MLVGFQLGMSLTENATVSAIRRIEGPGRERVRAAGEVLLDDVVLRGALEVRKRHAGLVGDGAVEAQEPGGGGVDRHRRVHLAERDLVEERVHVALVGDRDADLADLAAREHGVGVVAGLGGKVEGDREAGLALREVLAVELVRAAGVRVPRVRAHDPRTIGLRQAVILGHVSILGLCPEACGHCLRLSLAHGQPRRHHAPGARPRDRRMGGPAGRDRRSGTGLDGRDAPRRARVRAAQAPPHAHPPRPRRRVRRPRSPLSRDWRSSSTRWARPT